MEKNRFDRHPLRGRRGFRLLPHQASLMVGLTTDKLFELKISTRDCFAILNSTFYILHYKNGMLIPKHTAKTKL